MPCSEFANISTDDDRKSRDAPQPSLGSKISVVDAIKFKRERNRNEAIDGHIEICSMRFKIVKNVRRKKGNVKKYKVVCGEAFLDEP